MRLQIKILIVFFAIGLAACQSRYNLFNQEMLQKDAAYELQQTLLGAQNMDMNRVYTVRMLVNGTRVDATSLSPSVLALEGKEEKRAATVLCFTSDYRQLIFFTRDPETGEGYSRRIALNDLQKKPSFEFPLVVGTTVTPAKFEIIDVTVLP